MLLSRSVHSAEKSAQVSCECDDNHGHGFDRKAVSRQDLFSFPSGFHEDEPHHTDQDARYASHHQMQQKDALQSLTFEFPLPRENSGGYYGYGCDRRDKQVVVGRQSQQALLLPLRKEIKEDADDKQRDREVDQHDVLRMLCEKYRFYVERMQGRSLLTAR